MFDQLKSEYVETVTTCLIVDDDTDDQEIFSMAVKELGGNFHCVFASNGMEALTRLKNRELTPDYVFLDLNMPKLNGLQCLKELKEHPALRHIPVVIYSTSSMQSYIDEALSAGAATFLTKPSYISELTNELSDFFTGHNPRLFS